MGRFAAQVDAWATKSKKRLDVIVKQSVMDVFALAQKPVASGGNMPIDTGFLRASLATQLNGSAMAFGPTLPDSYILTVAGMEAGDYIVGTWTANYAAHVEYGTSGRSGRRFRGQAALQWENIVNRNTAAAKRIAP